MRRALTLLWPIAFLAGCVRVEVAPIKATVDVNLKIDRSLDDFYSFQQPGSGAASRPATRETAIVLPSTSTRPVLPE